MLIFLGPLAIFWHILMPRTGIKLYLNLIKINTIIKHTLLISVTNSCIQVPNSQTSIIIAIEDIEDNDNNEAPIKVEDSENEDLTYCALCLVLLTSTIVQGSRHMRVTKIGWAFNSRYTFT